MADMKKAIISGIAWMDAQDRRRTTETELSAVNLQIETTSRKVHELRTKRRKLLALLETLPMYEHK